MTSHDLHPDPAGAQEDEIDPEEEENSNELLWLLKQVRQVFN